MGEFTQNLLKLTEFPFSYSLIGLIALISGHDVNAPLLLLMGFVATTLSICDPLGALQRRVLTGQVLTQHKSATIDDIGNATVFGELIQKHFFFPIYLYAMLYRSDPVRKRVKGYKLLWGFNKFSRAPSASQAGNEGDENHMEKIDMEDILEHLEGAKRQAIKTKWITSEVDRITSLMYFIVIISAFIIALHVFPDFIQKFTEITKDFNTAILGTSVFSALALGAVSYMFTVRIRGLQEKSTIVFKYLTALEAIRAENEKEIEKFQITLKDIERYLNDNDWTLAKYWVQRLIMEYSNFLGLFNL